MNKGRSAGFTLVEILVVILIVSIVAAGGVASYRQYRLLADAEQLRNNIALLKPIALNVYLAKCSSNIDITKQMLISSGSINESAFSNPLTSQSFYFYIDIPTRKAEIRLNKATSSNRLADLAAIKSGADNNYPSYYVWNVLPNIDSLRSIDLRKQRELGVIDCY